MKKTVISIFRTIVLGCICMIAAVSGYAQEVVSTYDIKTHEHFRNWGEGPIPIILFGALFVAGVYFIYHYWANGRLTDDMS